MLAIHPILSLLSFWFPLILSAKAILKPNKNIQFLLLYWISYVAISNVQYYLIEFNIIPLKSFVLVLGDLIELWLFYSHGCLVLAYYYLPKLLKQTENRSVIDTLDYKFMDPLVSTFVVRNAFVQSFFHLVSTKFPPIDDLMHFNRELCKHFSSKQRRLSFLAFSVEYFCYMDLPTQLHSRYLKSEKLIRDLSSSVLRAASASAHRTSSYLETPSSNESDTSDPIVCDSFDDVIYTPRLLSSRNATPKDPLLASKAGLLDPSTYTAMNYISLRNYTKGEMLESGQSQALPKVRSLGQMEAGRKKSSPRQTAAGERLEPPYPLRSGSG